MPTDPRCRTSPPPFALSAWDAPCTVFHDPAYAPPPSFAVLVTVYTDKLPVVLVACGGTRSTAKKPKLGAPFLS